MLRCLHEEEMDMKREPQLYLCDDWIRPVEVIKKPGELVPHEKFRVTPRRIWIAIEDDQREEADPGPRMVNSLTLTDEEAQIRCDELDQSVHHWACLHLRSWPGT